MRQIFLISLCLLSLQFSWSQENSSPYKTDFWKDGAWIAGGVGLNVLGFSLVQNKDELTTAELMALNRNDISKINRGAVGNYSKSADEASYIPFYASFASPALLLLGDYFVSKGEHTKAIEFYQLIFSINNLNKDLYDQARSQLAIIANE